MRDKRLSTSPDVRFLPVVVRRAGLDGAARGHGGDGLEHGGPVTYRGGRHDPSRLLLAFQRAAMHDPRSE